MLEAQCGKRVVFGVEIGVFWLKISGFGSKTREKRGVKFTDEYMALIWMSFIPCRLSCFRTTADGFFLGGGVGVAHFLTDFLLYLRPVLAAGRRVGRCIRHRMIVQPATLIFCIDEDLRLSWHCFGVVQGRDASDKSESRHRTGQRRGTVFYRAAFAASSPNFE